MSLIHSYVHTSKLMFPSPSEEEEVRNQGFLAQREGKVDVEAQRLGTKFSSSIEKGEVREVDLLLISQEVGYGVFARKEILEGDFVGEYTGLIRKHDVNRYLEPLNAYCMVYPLLAFVLDARDFGNQTRFMNHSYQPNLQAVSVFYEGLYHRIFIACQRIEKGDQLLYDYGRKYWCLRNPPLVLR